MTLSNILVPNISNFHNLALFICHLFVGGSFRYGDIIYDPNVFDGHLTTQIDSICPVQVPWQITDITQSTSSYRQPNERTDHIMQLIFFNPEHFAQEIDKFNEYFTYYRIFVFLSRDEIEMEKSMSVVRKLSPTFNSLSLFCNLENGSINVYWINRNGEISDLSIGLEDHNPGPMDLFDRTFSEYDRMQPLAIRVNSVFQKKRGQISHHPIHGRQFVANWFLSTLNGTSINMTCIPLRDPTTALFHQSVVPKHRKYYKELSLEYETIHTDQSYDIF